MCPKATVGLAAVALFASAGSSAFAQSDGLRTDWRRIGNSAIELGLPSAATGPVDRVWYAADGNTLYARTHSGRTFQTVDFETWKPVADASITPPAENNPPAPNPPEPGSRVRTQRARMYAFARNVFRSDDGGDTWTNLTAYQGASILGAPLSDVAVSPSNPDEITVSNAAGVWRSVDAGLTWTGLNSSLPNLPIRRLFGVPAGMRGVRIGLSIDGAPELEWAPGEKDAWRVDGNADVLRDAQWKQSASQALKAHITAVGSSGDVIYAGSDDGRLWASLDKGATWSGWSTVQTGPVEGIFVDPKDPRIALAALGAHPGALPAGVQPVHVMRTMNAGLFWDDSTSNLPDVAAHGVTADRSSNAVYVATDAGVFYASIDLASAGRAVTWTAVKEGLPNAPVMDVRLDAGGNQLYAAVAGYGVYAAIAPHRFRDIRVVNAADYTSRPAAPGSLLSVLGAHITSAQAGDNPAPVLATDDTGTQIQVPFDAKGQSLALALMSARGRTVTGFPLRQVSPAIFVGPDGAPMILDADSGVMLDASNPAHSGTRIQILATGLGRVDPDWAVGVPGPLANPPRVVAPVHVYLDREPVEVSRAVLAPYVGFYLIEVQLPRIVNAGPAEIYIEADGQPSNPVRLYIEP